MQLTDAEYRLWSLAEDWPCGECGQEMHATGCQAGAFHFAHPIIMSRPDGTFVDPYCDAATEGEQA